MLKLVSVYHAINTCNTLRGQTVHWIGARFGVCSSLESREKCLNMLKLCRTDKKKKKKDQREMKIK